MKIKISDIESVSIDKDLEQLTHRQNVRIFSLMAKYKGVNGSYKVVIGMKRIIPNGLFLS